MEGGGELYVYDQVNIGRQSTIPDSFVRKRNGKRKCVQHTLALASTPALVGGLTTSRGGPTDSAVFGE